MKAYIPRNIWASLTQYLEGRPRWARYHQGIWGPELIREMILGSFQKNREPNNSVIIGAVLSPRREGLMMGLLGFHRRDLEDTENSPTQESTPLPSESILLHSIDIMFVDTVEDLYKIVKREVAISTANSMLAEIRKEPQQYRNAHVMKAAMANIRKMIEAGLPADIMRKLKKAIEEVGRKSTTCE